MVHRIGNSALTQSRGETDVDRPPAAAMGRGEWALLLAVVGASLAILGNTTYFPMNDAPSHIGTSVIAFETLKGDPFFTAHYRVLPVPLPYWANTLLMLPFVPLFGALKAFVVVMALYVVALPLSFYLLMRTAAPENARLTAVAALAAFNWAYWLGEANFILGQPAVLFALALFLRIPVWGARAVVGFLAAAAFAYASHIFAITALLVAIGALTLLSLASRLHPSLARWRFVRTQWLIVFSVVGLFAVGAFFVLQRGTTNFLDHSRANFGIIFDLRPWRLAKVAIDPLQSPTMAGAWPALAFSTAVGAVLLFSGRRAAGGMPRTLGPALDIVNPALFAPAAALLGLFYLGPVGTVREGAIGQRFVLLAFLLLLGAFRLGRSRWGTALLTTALAVFGVYKLTDAWRLHRRSDAVVTDVSRNLLSRIPERSRVLPLKDLTATEEVDYLYHRIANYVVVERHGYSANILATPGQQPLQHVRVHVKPQGHRASHRSPSERELDESDWEYYDYLVIQTDRELPDVRGIEDRATLVGEVRGFRLYRVNRAAATASQ